MKFISNILGIVSLLLVIIAFIPLLGWLNWVVIPFAIVGLMISAVSNSKGGKTMCGMAVLLGMLRLILGGGIL